MRGMPYGGCSPEDVSDLCPQQPPLERVTSSLCPVFLFLWSLFARPLKYTALPAASLYLSWARSTRKQDSQFFMGAQTRTDALPYISLIPVSGSFLPRTSISYTLRNPTKGRSKTRWTLRVRSLLINPLPPHFIYCTWTLLFRDLLRIKAWKQCLAARTHYKYRTEASPKKRV